MKSEENTSPNVSVKSKTMKRFSKAADKELNANFSEGGGVVVNSKLIKTKYKTGRWTDDEHNRFLEAIEKYGRDWKRVQQHVGTRSSTQSRSHAQKFFRKINLTDVKPGIGLIKHKSLDVASRCVKKLKVTEEESSDEELLVWIDFVKTPNPRIRKTDLFVSNETKIEQSNSQIPKDEEKETSFKPGDEEFSSPKSENKKEPKASSEKMKKLPNLLPSTLQITSTGKKTVIDDSTTTKDGRSLDNVNLSLKEYEIEKNALACKEPIKIPSNDEPINPVKLLIDGDSGENGVYKERGLGFGEDNLSCNSGNFIKNSEKNHEADDIKHLGLGDDNLENDDLEMDFSDKMDHLDNVKALEMNDFEADYDAKLFGVNEEEISHHSALLNNEFMDPHSEELNYF